MTKQEKLFNDLGNYHNELIRFKSAEELHKRSQYELRILYNDCVLFRRRYLRIWKLKGKGRDVVNLYELKILLINEHLTKYNKSRKMKSFTSLEKQAYLERKERIRKKIQNILGGNNG